MSQKYNRSFHAPWSPGGTSDDKRSKSVDTLLNTPIIITEKIDGSNASLETEGCFARSHSGSPMHSSFDGLKALHATIRHKIPGGCQLFGEWAFALHSIAYSELPGYFLMFGVRENATWSSWEETEMWANEIEVPTVPVLFSGTVCSERELQDLTESLMLPASKCGGEREGVVVRVAGSFLDADFPNCLAKIVRASHVQTDTHWKHKTIVKNGLART